MIEMAGSGHDFVGRVNFNKMTASTNTQSSRFINYLHSVSTKNEDDHSRNKHWEVFFQPDIPIGTEANY